MYDWMHCFFGAGSIPIIGGQFAAKPEVCWIFAKSRWPPSLTLVYFLLEF